MSVCDQPISLEGDGYLRPRDVAKLLGISRATVYRLLEEGHLPYVQILKSKRVPKSAVRDYLARQTVGA